jgi:hypothetical protein
VPLTSKRSTTWGRTRPVTARAGGPGDPGPFPDARGSPTVTRETRDGPFLSVLEDLEILLLEIGHRTTVTGDGHLERDARNLDGAAEACVLRTGRETTQQREYEERRRHPAVARSPPPADPRFTGTIIVHFALHGSHGTSVLASRGRCQDPARRGAPP